jgi:putative FmdB family regulatory protein
MPLYEYRCNTCGSSFEKMMRWSESGRVPVCPNCQSDDTSKKITTFASSSSGGESVTSPSSRCAPSGHFG